MFNKIKFFFDIIILNFIFRYLKISVICASIEFISFIILFSHLKFNLIFSYTLSFFLAFLIGLFGHSYYTFKLGQIFFLNIFSFTVQCAVSLLIGFNLINIFLKLGINPFFSKGLQLAFTFIFNILFGRFVTFKKR